MLKNRNPEFKKNFLNRKINPKLYFLNFQFLKRICDDKTDKNSILASCKIPKNSQLNQ
ncbi:hypothetical protein LEP1GSC125_3305 [Leptospira mayottensis 200901122]|uniref:Uncharacterized protein n=1 Tax=Leptospira mayottensis 200901122 TaxID=1193010 RepID=A0AA87SYQ7_9LEPT|nr:hypothetical protein LEP1GSC125_3305 [Leptospira mayottensis 200901122]